MVPAEQRNINNITCSLPADDPDVLQVGPH